MLELKDATDAAIYIRVCSRVIRKQTALRGLNDKAQALKFCDTLDQSADKLLNAIPATQLQEAMRNYNPPQETVRA